MHEALALDPRRYGLIGTSTLDLVALHPDRFDVIALSAARQVAALADAARRTNARLAVIDDEQLLPELEHRLAGTGCRAAPAEPR